MAIKIETGVPLAPIKHRNRSSKYPFDKLGAPAGEVLSSFFVPDAVVASLSSAASRYIKTESGRGKEFTVRGLTENGVAGVRVWRTA